MSFVDGFFTFSLDIVNPELNLYESCRIKTAKHPEESIVYLISRVVALAHGFEQGIEFSPVKYKSDQPTIQTPNGIGGISKWTEVGSPDLKKVKKALANHHDASLSVYFHEQSQVSTFCHSMRGTKKNWLKPVNFFQISETLIHDLSEQLDFRNKWLCTFVDEAVFIETNDLNFSGQIKTIDIWREYQNSIGNSK